MYIRKIISKIVAFFSDSQRNDYEAVCEMQLTTTEQKDERASKALAMQGSENMSHLLVLPVISSSLEGSEYAGELDDEELDYILEQYLECRIVLRAPQSKAFDGQKVWDVMMSLNLRWGDGDIFHWVNNTEFGDDSYFSVATTTAPRYFIPEEIAAGRFNPENLVFSFIILCTAEPKQILESMIRAAAYAQQRLGGTFRETPDQTRAYLNQACEELSKIGIVPGSDQALMIDF